MTGHDAVLLLLIGVTAALVLVALGAWLAWRRTDRRLTQLAVQLDFDARIESATLQAIGQMREVAKHHFQRQRR